MTPISGLGSKGPGALGSCNDCGEPVVGSSLCDECWAKHQESPSNAIVPPPPKIEPVEEAAKKTLDAFAELIAALVAVGRFHEVQRLITIGISLQRVKKQSAEDYLAREEQEGMFDGNGLIIPAAPVRGMNIIGAGKQPTAAATVAAPTIGCPVPEFPESEIRATRVLETFLSPEQRADYRRHGVVMATGADTGHQYAITHRGRTANMRNVSMRSLYDMTEDRPLCVHDWTVPPPEEMLALLLCVSLPGKEKYIRSLPEAML